MLGLHQGIKKLIPFFVVNYVKMEIGDTYVCKCVSSIWS